MGYEGSGELRDEIYIQIVKQLHGDTSEDIKSKYMQLLAGMGNVFSPSQLELNYAILNFLIWMATSKETPVKLKKMARFCYQKIMLRFVLGMRGELPPYEELKCTLNMKQMYVTIYFMNENTIQISIETHFNIKQLLKNILKTLGLPLDRLSHYQLYEVKETNHYKGN